MSTSPWLYDHETYVITMSRGNSYYSPNSILSTTTIMTTLCDYLTKTSFSYYILNVLHSKLGLYHPISLWCNVTNSLYPMQSISVNMAKKPGEHCTEQKLALLLFYVIDHRVHQPHLHQETHEQVFSTSSFFIKLFACIGTAYTAVLPEVKGYFLLPNEKI